MRIPTYKLGRFGLTVIVSAGIFIFYVATVGFGEAISSNIQVGRLSWLRADGFLDAIDLYVLPARSLARVPCLAWPFGTSERFWNTITDASICINYGMHHQQVPISDVPKDLIKTFARAYPNAEVIKVSKALGGRKGTEFVFWVIRFMQDGKLREALMETTRKVDMAYDVQEPVRNESLGR